jgi:glutaredoxin 3
MAHLSTHAILFSFLLALASCKGSTPSGDVGTAQQDLRTTHVPMAAFVVRAGDDNLVFQYFDAGGKIHATPDLSMIPDDRRTNVIVLSKALQKGDLPADQIVVANLEAPDREGNYPFRLVSRYEGAFAPAATAPRARPEATQAKVLLFSTKWCPHCRTAHKWLTDNGIPFEEHDVEADANARALLVQMGKEQGIPEHMLSSVPILAVNGKLILGFNEGEVRRMLGK